VILGGSAGERSGGALLALDGVHRTGMRQSESESAETGEQVKRRTARTDTGNNLLDEDHFSRSTGLQKSPWRNGHGHPRQQHSDRAAFQNRDVFAR